MPQALRAAATQAVRPVPPARATLPAQGGFSHGQMYTAVSRAGDPNGLRVHALGSRNPVDGHVYTRNIVWEEALA